MPGPLQAARAALAAFFLLAGTTFASAQQPAPPPAPGALVLEPMEKNVVLAPEVKVTKINGQIGTLAGGSAGWVNDTHFLIGGAAYWLTDRKADSRNLGYGGLLVGWFFDSGRPVSVSARTLVGFGRISETATLAIPYCALPEESLCFKRRVDPDALIQPRVRFHRDFLLAEPEIDVVARLSRLVSLTAGAGYRLAPDYQRADVSLNPRGATGAFSVQFKF
jgi:hypothetical protein